MTELRRAAEQALRQLQKDDVYLGHRSKTRADAIEALRQALAEPEQEPVCFLRETSWSYEIAPWDDPNGIPVYTAPPKREWVGLTDEEIYDYADKFLYQHGSNYGIRSFGKAIEDKLKEKNT